MTAHVYVHPIGLASGPQAEEGGAIRLAGGLAYASRFALVVRDGGAVIRREVFGARNAVAVLGALEGELAQDAAQQWDNLSKSHPPLELGARTIRLDQPQIMGILNVTPDSFSDGGDFLDRPDAGRAHAAAMLEAGAAIIDIGGESTRPGAAATWEDDENRRVLPAIEYCAAMGAAISIDTRRAGVLEAALQAGAHMANDVSAMRFDDRMSGLVASAGCPVVLMHAPGTGDDLHEGGSYTDVVSEVFDFLKSARTQAIAAGIAQGNIMLDPGIGFGKTLGREPRADECASAVPCARQSAAGGGQSQTHDRRSFQRGDGGSAAGRVHRADDAGDGCGRADAARPRCARQRAGTQCVARNARCGAHGFQPVAARSIAWNCEIVAKPSCSRANRQRQQINRSS